MELNQSDIDKIRKTMADTFYSAEMILVSAYEDLPRSKARKLIQEQIKKFMDEMK